jgi:hypothetical protein
VRRFAQLARARALHERSSQPNQETPMNAINLDTFTTINPEQLADVAGGFDFGRMVDNGNRWGNTGALVGGGVGTVAGGVAGGVAGAAAGGVGAVPGAVGGAAAGAGIGAGIGGGLGWLGGAATDAWNQLRGN